LTAQAKEPVLPLPAAVSPAPVAAVPKAAAKTDKPAVPPTTPVQAQPVPRPAAVAPPTAAATASLLPTDKAAAPDFRWEDVNAVAGDAVTLHFDKTNWLYLDTPSQQKTLGFQSINRDKDSTTFQFKPTTPGQYTLEFQRQDLVNQSTDLRKVKLTVVAPGTRTAATGTALAPQTTTAAATDALEASRQLAAAGKTAEAVQRLLQSYKADDARVNLELARLLNQSGQDDQALSYLDKNLTLTGPDFQGTLELGTRLAAAKDPQKKLPAYVKLWTAGTTAPPEELYLQVFEALRSQGLASQVKDWSARYASWYPAPKLRDRYLFQLGHALEEPGDGRDVKGAWKAYNEVVEMYPLSPYWKAAGERAAYLNRHFLQVR
jgi:tetratricopeptide (TPR) repeat protein